MSSYVGFEVEMRRKEQGLGHLHERGKEAEVTQVVRHLQHAEEHRYMATKKKRAG